MLEEAFNTDQLVQGIEGKVIAELFDAKSGELVQREETHNFISTPALDFLKQSQRTQFSRGIYPLNNSLNNDNLLLDKSDAVLVLTDLATATNPVTETHMYGRFIGWACKTAYSGSDTYRGSPNGTLCTASDSQVQWVFDWPTNAANGTINSLGWVKPAGFYTSGDVPGTYFPSWSSVIASYVSPQTWRFFTRASTSQSFGVVGVTTTIRVLDANFAQTNSFSASTQFTAISGIAWDGVNNKLWVLGISSGVAKIASYNGSGTLIDALVTVANRTYTAMAFDGTNLWCTTGGGNGSTTITVYAINPVSGSDVSNFSYGCGGAPDGLVYESPVGIAWEPSRSTLWIRHNVTGNARPSGNGQYGFRTEGSLSRDNQPTATLRGFNTSGVQTTTQISLSSISEQYGTLAALTNWNAMYLGGAVSTFYQAAYEIRDVVGYPAASYLNAYFTSGNLSQDFDVIDAYNFLIPRGASIDQILADGMGSRALLGSSIVKTNSQTLRITYQVNFT